MAKFITGNELNHEIEKLFDSANSQLFLISPYIKLHERFVSALKAKINIPELKIIVVFGKNEEDLSKSFPEIDFQFLKEFPNIEIRYAKRLHAKYYANETNAILTSMNLHSYSQDNNIEAGVLTKSTLIADIASAFFIGEENLDKQAWNCFMKIIQQSKPLYQKFPIYENAMFGLSKKYKRSVVECDELSSYYDNNQIHAKKYKFEVHHVTKSTSQISDQPLGYCIRTGKRINFNTEMPLCDEAYKSWVHFKNGNYPEKYCHYSGEVSNGETSFAKPILRKNWQLAMKIK